MKKLVLLAALAMLAPAVEAKVWITVYRYDGVTPFPAVDPNHPDVYRDIMVGTRLTLVISSDAPGSWGGELLVPWTDALNGKLSGRGAVAPEPGGRISYVNYRGSCLDAAGTFATARDRMDPSKGVGLSFINDASLAAGVAYPADWFVVDYHAEQVGECRVELYGATWGGSSGSLPLPGPSVSPEALVQTLSFTQVPARDFNGDRIVDFKDLALLASHWNSHADPKSPDAAFDLNVDSRIDLGDLALFSGHWLERTDSAGASQ